MKFWQSEARHIQKSFQLHLWTIIQILTFLLAIISSIFAPSSRTPLSTTSQHASPIPTDPPYSSVTPSQPPSPLVSLGRPTSPGDWPMYLLSNSRNSFNQVENAITVRTAPDLVRYWTYHGKSPISAQPVEANGIIYWGSWDGLEHATYVNGKQAWATFLGQTVDGTCDPSTVGIASTAAIAPITTGTATTLAVFVGGGDANLYALNATTGKIIWRTSLGASPAHFIWSSPVVYRNSVYIGVSSFGDCPAIPGKLFQIDSATGAIQHIFSVVPDGCIGGGIWSSPTIDSKTGILYISTGSKDSCGTPEHYTTSLIELRASDLSFIDSWQVPPSRNVNDSDFGASPTLFTAKIGGTSYKMVGMTHKNGVFYAFIRGAVANGPAWETGIAGAGDCPECGDGSISTAAWDGSRLYVAGGSTSVNGSYCPGSVRALDPANGNFLWEHCLPDGPVLAPVTAVPGVVAVTEGNAIYLVAASSGKTLFTYRDTSSNSTFWGAASIAHGVLYAGNVDGNLYAFGPVQSLLAALR